MNRRRVSGYEGFVDILDAIISENEIEWDAFYSAESPRAPFVCDDPDENLVEWIGAGLVRSAGSCLELGCGNGRNAIWLASQGWRVTAWDRSEVAISQAVARARELDLNISFDARSIFAPRPAGSAYDLVYDSGCFHHIAPHRRTSYIDLLLGSLSVDGRFGLTCFNENGGSNKTDLDVYRERRMFGGLAFTEDEVEQMFGNFFSIETKRRMRNRAPASGLFGVDIVTVYLMRLKRSQGGSA